METTDPELYKQFKNIFDKFAKPEDLVSDKKDEKESDEINISSEKYHKNNNLKLQIEEVKLSKKKRKLLNRLSVSQLKQLVPRPDVVEAHDTSSIDPRLLVYLKSYRNTVQVPRHWNSVRFYLAGKRGIEKPPAQLPDFIAETGIAKIRESVLTQENSMKSSQKAKARMQPRTGRIDVDYKVLHDAFFKYQTKPPMTKHGDLYYESKEFEVKIKEKKPGALSKALIEALGMTPNSPPPWLVNMQRYGPPPSYSFLKIPGLNAPLPPGCEYGYHPGGWGKPPVDEYGRPIYGDVFGVATVIQDLPDISVDKTRLWGVCIQSAEEEVEGFDEELENEDNVEALKNVNGKIQRKEGILSSEELEGASSVVTGIETPSSTFELRKTEGSASVLSDVETIEHENYKELYQVINEKQSQNTNEIYGSDKAYIVPIDIKENGNEVLVEEVKPEKEGKRKSRRLEENKKEFKF